ncbi:MAG: aminotransferase class III-fold pyridoxal phosphate-dependent enzyme [Solidesulfovibrio sp. DCME]|uniref:aminotransferase class III-fold pyridoxal phosphate-dependent enzyme n=1 Tax=Solidesulfovibrio sp. DCME TaxID=3447380 RepID=UPI003D13D2B4
MRRYDGSRSVDERLQRVLATKLEAPMSPDGGHRVIFRTASGAWLTDLDGNSYVDFSNGLGSVLLGHNDPRVNEALVMCLQSRGEVGASPTVEHLHVAEVVASQAGGDASVAFYSSGTAAVRAAAEVLRKVTGRRMLLSAGYHGWDPLWHSGSAPFEPNQLGVMDFFHDLGMFKKALKRYRGDIAGLVLSPDYLYLDAVWYRTILDTCREEGILVACDDVKLGYRYRPGGSLARVQARADLTVLGKGLANGHPLACVVGPPELLEGARDMVATGLHAVLPFVAARATLAQLSETTPYDNIRRAGDMFLAQARQFFASARLPVEIIGDGALFVFVFGSEALENAFYARSMAHGLLFFAGDNQSPSAAFDDGITDVAIKRLAQVVDGLTLERPPEGWPAITDDMRWRVAWRTMEGFPFPHVPAQQRDAWLRDRLGEGTTSSCA